MKKSMRIGFWFIKFLLGLILIAIILELVFPGHTNKAKARIIYTRWEEKNIATSLKQHAMETVGQTNINNGLILQSFFSTNDDYYTFNRTNEQGNLLDLWRTPYQIKILAQTNFIISSAGPNKFFGDDDDIIFNSASNYWVKP
jgi:hypothetical protein